MDFCINLDQFAAMALFAAAMCMYIANCMYRRR